MLLLLWRYTDLRKCHVVGQISLIDLRQIENRVGSKHKVTNLSEKYIEIISTPLATGSWRKFELDVYQP